MFNFHTHTSQKNAIVNIDSIEDFSPIDGVYYSLGIHPWYSGFSIESLEELVLKCPQIVSIGECGIDKVKSIMSLSRQVDIFKQQVHLSEKYELPMVLHVVKGYNEIVKIKKEINPKQNWVVHGFNKFKETKNLLKEGVYLSFGHALLVNSQLQKEFAQADIDRIFLETDNSELNIKNLYKFAADLKGIDIDQLINQIRLNLKHLTNGKLA